MDTDDEWLTLPQAATLMRMTRAAIAQMRYRGDGPTFYRLSAKTILYKRVRSARMDGEPRVHANG